MGRNLVVWISNTQYNTIAAMKINHKSFLCIGFLASAIFTAPFVFAQSCGIDDKDCIFKTIEAEALKIDNTSWRDQTYRELAKSKAANGDIIGALALIEKIETPDTQAMTIRGIGMEVADLELDKETADGVFSALREQAEIIEHPPSYAIALTYIAMGQAFAGDNEGAWQTAASMENDALRHKAYGETAEIQAEAGDYDAAMKSIAAIESTAFKNKAYALVSKILTERGQYEDGLKAAMQITNSYKKANALQLVLDQQNADGEDNDD